MGEFHGMDPLLDFSEEAKAERETLKKELGKALSFQHISNIEQNTHLKYYS